MTMILEEHAPELPGADVAGEGLQGDDWLAVRRSGLGGSDIAGMLGIEGAYGNPVTVWRSKVEELVQQESVAMEAGHRLEQPLAEWFSDATGVATFQPPPITIYRSKELPIALASPDRLAYTPQTGATTAWAEVKNAGSHKAGEWETGPPLYYLVQCQWQAAVSGFDICYLAALIGGTDFRHYIVQATRAQHERMFDFAVNFWNSYVLTNTPPPVDESEKTRRALMEHYAQAVPETVEGGSELAEALRAYQAAKAAENAAHKASTLAHNQIMAVLREKEVGLVTGEEACRFPSVERKSYVVPAGSYRKLYVSKKWQ